MSCPANAGHPRSLLDKTGSPAFVGDNSRSAALRRLRRGVFSAGLRRVHALCPALLVLEAGDARPAALVLILHLDVQRAKPLAGELDLVAVHERVQTAMVGAGRQD